MEDMTTVLEMMPMLKLMIISVVIATLSNTVLIALLYLAHPLSKRRDFSMNIFLMFSIVFAIIGGLALAAMLISISI